MTMLGTELRRIGKDVRPVLVVLQASFHSERGLGKIASYKGLIPILKKQLLDPLRHHPQKVPSFDESYRDC